MYNPIIEKLYCCLISYRIEIVGVNCYFLIYWNPFNLIRWFFSGHLFWCHEAIKPVIYFTWKTSWWAFSSFREVLKTLTCISPPAQESKREALTEKRNLFGRQKKLDTCSTILVMKFQLVNYRLTGVIFKLNWNRSAIEQLHHKSIKFRVQHNIANFIVLNRSSTGVVPS